MRAIEGRLRGSACALLIAALAGTGTAQETEKAPAEARFTGRVVDENGEPLAGVAVGVCAPGAFVDTARLLAAPTTATEANGSYVVCVGEAHADGTLVLAAAGRQACAIALHFKPRGGAALGDAILVPGAMLAGRVRGETGAPLPGVPIRVESAVVDSSGTVDALLLAGAVSDAQGIFAVPCVPRTGMRLTAMAEGYLTESRLVAQHSPVDLTLQKVGVVRGVVVDAAGMPAAGAQVYGVTVEDGRKPQPVLSAADGSFAITVPTTGRFRLSAHDALAPHRSFSSGLLRGPSDHVVVAERPHPAARELVVEVVDAAGAPIPRFRLSHQLGQPDPPTALLHHAGVRRGYEGTAKLTLTHPPGQPSCVVVDAAGYGFEMALVRDPPNGLLEIALGPEAVLKGTVVDAVTNEPMAGVAVRALPKGLSSGIGRLEEAWPRTDAKGRYRIEGLRPGDYDVQAHAPGRHSSDVVATTLDAQRATELGLVVPAPRWLELELTGTIPPGPAPRLSIARFRRSVLAGDFEIPPPMPAPHALTRVGALRLGPLRRGVPVLELFVPSRTRIGTGTLIPLGELDPSHGPARLALPDLARILVSGLVRLPREVPTERVAVVAHVAARADAPWGRREVPHVAALDAAAGFTLDLPRGRHVLQLVDLQTGIVFHTEEQELALDEKPAPVEIRPQIHWLEIECAPKEAGADVVLRGFAVRVPRPRQGLYGGFVPPMGGSGEADDGWIAFRLGAARQRWLVPGARIEIDAHQTFAMLQPGSRGYRSNVVDRALVEVAQPEHRVTLRIPAPPSDEELLRGEGEKR